VGGLVTTGFLTAFFGYKLWIGLTTGHIGLRHGNWASWEARPVGFVIAMTLFAVVGLISFAAFVALVSAFVPRTEAPTDDHSPPDRSE
jgi:hypothetical protein